MEATGILNSALRNPPLAYPVAMDVYDNTQPDFQKYGKDLNKINAYIVYNQSANSLETYVENEARTEDYYFQVHIFCLRNFKYHELVKEVRNRLFKNGFSGGDMALNTVEEEKIRHIVLEVNYTKKVEE